MAINVCKHCGKNWTAQPRKASGFVVAVCKGCLKEKEKDNPPAIKNFSLTRSTG